MSLDDIQGNINKAAEMREKLLRNKMDHIEESAVSLWEQGFIKDSELADRINSIDTRDSFMYYSLVLNELKEQSNRATIQNFKKGFKS